MYRSSCLLSCYQPQSDAQAHFRASDELVHSKVGPSQTEPTLSVFVSGPCIRHGSRDLHVSSRELELIIFLASFRQDCPTPEIANALWPDSQDADLALRVCVSRVRSRLGRDSVVCSSGAYSLGNGLHVDLHENRKVLSDARRQKVLLPETRCALLARATDIYRGSYKSIRWEWFNAVRGRIDELWHDMLTIIVRDAMRSGEYELSLDLCGKMLECDPCDEVARELRIRTFVMLGEVARARREYRIYRDVLEQELSAQPTTELAWLVDRICVAGSVTGH